MTKNTPHKCPDTTDGALLVIRILGFCLIVIVIGGVVSTFLQYRINAFPEWIKDTVTGIVIALTALLAKTSRSEVSLDLPDRSVSTARTNIPAQSVPTTDVPSTPMPEGHDE